MLQLNYKKYDFGKFVLGYNETLINEMKSVCFPHPPRGYCRRDLLPVYFFFFLRYFERLKNINLK